MSISTAFNSALSGLTAASRTSSLISDNIANALTPGYARRSLELVGDALGSGVGFAGVRRHTDPVLIANRREAEAVLGHAKTIDGFHSRMERVSGTVGEETSLAGHVAALESRLIEAASLPGSAVRLDAAVASASDLATSLNMAAREVQQARTDADREIARQVDSLGRLLTEVEVANGKIPALRASGEDVSSLLDRRQTLIDEINRIVPVNEVPRGRDAVALYTDGGAILLDGKAADVTFRETGLVTAHMTFENGALGGVAVNGVPIGTKALAGGSLAAQFDIRDVLGAEAQADLDAMARDLVERFQAPGLDATLGAAAAGMFTDGGKRFDGDTTGLASRIALSEVLSPGQSWRLRDGLGATTPGPPGEARLLQGFVSALENARAQSDLVLGSGAMTASDLANAVMSRSGGRAHQADQKLARANSEAVEMQRLEMEKGVDTDTELQSLMRVEQVYAANARLLETLDDMMDQLLRI
ncbi:flagellar hook-associated protein FlgK [Lutimaribacter marinistellae]|uniref:Flagellar hook-associated protein 1 n=1 Tax=Lutimaribacter marinistellae TaxID=1820329 RepID=A0ABV7TDC7_9RHOB